MISVDEALEKVLNLVPVLNSEERPILDCLNYVLAEHIYAGFNVPLVDNSAMDGYAVRSGDIQGVSPNQPKYLRLIGTIAAGSLPTTSVVSGTAMRIMTGAPIPDGADTVVPFELTDEIHTDRQHSNNSEIGILHELPADSNIRRNGEDVKEGELILARGKVLRPADIGLLASIGKKVTHVVRKPIVAILSTGDEVLELGEAIVPGKLYNSNSYSLAAQVITYGGIPKMLGIARDTIQELRSALLKGLDADIIVTTGGVSMGDYDKVKDFLKEEGNIHFWTVRMKPGKPIAFGTLNRNDGGILPLLGLPGNPVSSMITFTLFGRPAIYKMRGMTDFSPPVIKAVLYDKIKNTDNRRIYARVIVSVEENTYIARLTGAQGSGILTSVAKANGLAVISEQLSEADKGTSVDVILLDEAESLLR